MANVQVSYTHKLGDHYAAHERIQGIAGNGGNGWYRSEADVIDDIDRTGANSYYVNVNGRPVDVITDVHNGRKYIKTRPDGYAPNNLLNLPEPPSSLLP